MPRINTPYYLFKHSQHTGMYLDPTLIKSVSPEIRFVKLAFLSHAQAAVKKITSDALDIQFKI